LLLSLIRTIGLVNFELTKYLEDICAIALEALVRLPAHDAVDGSYRRHLGARVVV